MHRIACSKTLQRLDSDAEFVLADHTPSPNSLTSKIAVRHDDDLASFLTIRVGQTIFIGVLFGLAAV
jgi:hypothetical protein